MADERGLSLKRTVPFLLGGLLVFLIYIYFFIGINEIVAILRKVNLVYYSFAVASLFLIVLFNSLAWHYFLRPLSVKVSFRKAFLFTWIGNFVDLIIPAEAISGDASKVYLMAKESGENMGKMVASVISQRILAMVISLVSLIFSSIVLYTIRYELPVFVLNLVLLIIVGIVISLLFVFLCLLKQTLTRKLIDAVLRFLVFISRGRLKLDSMRVKATKMLCVFHGSMGILKSPKFLVAPVFFSSLSWIISIVLSYLVFVSLGQHVDFILILVVISISVNIQHIPLGIPGEVGLVEIVMASLYGLLGVEAGIATAATVLIRLVTVWLRIVIGLIAVQWIDLKDLLKQLRKDLPM